MYSSLVRNVLIPLYDFENGDPTRKYMRELEKSQWFTLEKIKEIERELEAMGPVNLKSLTDYDAERARYDEIVDKKTQLEEERKEILTFMEELEAEKTQKFLSVYNEIADNFATVFALFTSRAFIDSFAIFNSF